MIVCQPFSDLNNIDVTMPGMPGLVVNPIWKIIQTMDPVLGFSDLTSRTKHSYKLNDNCSIFYVIQMAREIIT